MGLFDWLTGTKRPAAGVVAVAPPVLREKLLGLNRATAPWQIRDGKDDGCDIVAEWKIVDAQWYEIFAKASLKHVFKVCLTLDESEHTVKAVDKEFQVEWRAGIPTLSIAASAFRGQKNEISFGTAYAFKETGEYGKVYEYRFNTGELKDPIKEAVTAAGWIYKGKIF